MIFCYLVIMIKECIWIMVIIHFYTRPDAVAVIIYFSDINITLRKTNILNNIEKYDENDTVYNQPYLNMPGQLLLFFNDKKFI